MKHTVVYVDRRGTSSDAFSAHLQAEIIIIEKMNGEIIAAIPNGGINETLGVWLIWKVTD